MIDATSGKHQARGGRSYFFLSYAHSPPLAGNSQADSDRWIGEFFDDLTDSVQRKAAPHSQIAPGVFDQELQLGSDFKASLKNALSAAEVFVPLYAPGYFARSWPGREWAAFRARLSRSNWAEPDGRFVPVLWIPLPAGQKVPGLHMALEFGASEPAYAENGLRALLRLTPFRASYELVVDKLAARIVELAENSPLPQADAPDIDEVTSPFEGGEHVADFTVIVAAPTRADAGADAAGYGDRRVDWQPYPGGWQSSLAAYAALVAEQLDFRVTIDGIEDIAESDRGAHHESPRARPHRDPGIVLVDPRLVASDSGARALESFVSDLPSWVIPLLVLRSDDEREGPLAARARAIVGKAAARVEPARQAMKDVRSLHDFVSLMPALITEAERRYLRHKPVLGSMARPGSKPTFTADRPHASPNLPHSAKEQPDA